MPRLTPQNNTCTATIGRAATIAKIAFTQIACDVSPALSEGLGPPYSGEYAAASAGKRPLAHDVVLKYADEERPGATVAQYEAVPVFSHVKTENTAPM